MERNFREMENRLIEITRKYQEKKEQSEKLENEKKEMENKIIEIRKRKGKESKRNGN